MAKDFIKTLSLIVCFILPVTAFSQTISRKGIIFKKDSTFYARINARIQTLYQGEYSIDDKAYEDGIQVRRARVKMEGFALSEQFEYKIELALSNTDMANSSPENSNSPNLVLDAFSKWNFAPGFSFWFGQTKLPGNRERVISSQKLQFVDRSLLNTRYNLDRDMGVQLHHTFKTGNVSFREVAALSMGEGRNITTGNKGGYDYTGRVEVYPLGEFKDEGDYFGADLSREDRPKLAVGLTYDYNDRASRERGQLGEFLSGSRDLKTFFADAMFKYRGFSVMTEFVDRETDGSAVVARNDAGDITEAFFTGTGFNLQSGYLFKNNVEIAGRYSSVNAENEIQEPDEKQWTLGFSKYFVDHTLKIQSDVSLLRENRQNSEVMYRFQVEIGF